MQPKRGGGDEYRGLVLTDEGFEWLEANRDRLVLKKKADDEIKDPRLTDPEADIPF
ncbi:MAG: hypothetical protein ABIF09_06390 [Gemmatimonadota bacterium]